ncbi:MAG: Holliday junction branch migration protein RuvA [Coriobacteriia bacterium]|nr:Holliday junction branch migration protein RuvA [Coriobacteriia bacterium]
MIAFLTGRVAGRSPSFALLDVGGVGYRLLMSTQSLAGLPADGDEVTVHTYLHVREDELTLYGFENEEERGLFELLITVSGVGPKVALAVLSSLRPDALRQAVASEDVALITSVPGIGKKTAQRLILELRDKLDVPDMPAHGVGRAHAAAAAEARDALVSMGFSPAEAAAALREAPAGASAEDLLRVALKMLGGGA